MFHCPTAHVRMQALKEHIHGLNKLPLWILEAQVNDVVLLEVAKRSMCDILPLGLALELEPYEIYNRIPENGTRLDRKVELLQLWKRQKGHDATYRLLLVGVARSTSDKQLLEKITDCILNYGPKRGDDNGSAYRQSCTSSSVHDGFMQECPGMVHLRDEIELLKQSCVVLEQKLIIEQENSYKLSKELDQLRRTITALQSKIQVLLEAAPVKAHEEAKTCTEIISSTIVPTSLQGSSLVECVETDLVVKIVEERPEHQVRLPLTNRSKNCKRFDEDEQLKDNIKFPRYQ